MNKTDIRSKKDCKNICLVTESTENIAVLSLAQSLSKLNCKVEVIAFNNSKNNLQIDDFSFNIHIVETKKIKPPIKKIKRVMKYLQSVQNAKPLQNKITEIGVDFDLIVSNMYLANITCRKLNIPNTHYCIHSVISSVIANYYNNETGLFKFIQKILYKFLVKKLYNNQKIITVSEGVKKDLIKLGIQPKTIQTIYNPLDFKDIKKQSNEYLIEEKDYIVHVGRFSKEKRHDVLINAYKQSGIKKNLLLLGDTNNEVGRQIKQLVESLGLQNQVIFKGWISNPFPYIKNADILVLSSDHEGFGMVLAEALILGTPIISTNCVGSSEILCHELKPFLSPVGDVGALAKNIKTMIDNPIKITDKYIDRFSAEKSAKQYLDLCS